MALSDLFRAAGVEPPTRSSKVGKMLAERGIPKNGEWRRIHDLPRRTLDLAAVPDLSPVWRIADHGCSGCDLCVLGAATLRKIQSAMLLEAEQLRGLYARVGVGWGKELACLLLPDALHARRAIILTDARLKTQMLDRDIPRYGKHFRLPLDRVAAVVSYSELSATDGGNTLEAYDPDAFICNEAHTLENDSVRSDRFWLAVKRRPNVPVCFLSGTLGVRGVKVGRKLPDASLRTFSIVPRNYRDADDWGRAVDPDPPQDAAPMEPGAILDLCGPGALADELEHADAELFIGAGPEAMECRRSVAWRILGRRQRETPGVVCTAGASVEARLVLRGRQLPPSPPVVEALARLRRLWKVGDDELADGKDVARYAQQISLGFYYRWLWPDGVKDLEWLGARSAWHKFVREWLARRSRPGCDSPELLRRAVERGDVTEGAHDYAEWLAVRDRFRPQPPTETVWLDKQLLGDDVLAWSRESDEPGIVWYSHLAVGEELRARGLTVFGSDEAGDEIEVFRGPVCAAAMSHHKGKNLQHFRRGLATYVPSSPVTWEQWLGRTHRAGQKADVVTHEVYQTDQAQRAALAKATHRALFASATSEPQRLSYAEREGIGEGEEERWLVR